MLEWVNRKSDSQMLNIDDAITQSLVKDFEMSEEQAVDFYFASSTYQKLTDETTNLYKQSWESIYNLVKQELNKWN